MNKVYQVRSRPFDSVAEREKSSGAKPHGRPIYDDATIENMVRYYGLKDDESLLKFIKSRGLQHDEQ